MPSFQSIHWLRQPFGKAVNSSSAETSGSHEHFWTLFTRMSHVISTPVESFRRFSLKVIGWKSIFLGDLLNVSCFFKAYLEPPVAYLELDPWLGMGNIQSLRMANPFALGGFIPTFDRTKHVSGWVNCGLKKKSWFSSKTEIETQSCIKHSVELEQHVGVTI